MTLWNPICVLKLQAEQLKQLKNHWNHESHISYGAPSSTSKPAPVHSPPSVPDLDLPKRRDPRILPATRPRPRGTGTCWPWLTGGVEWPTLWSLSNPSPCPSGSGVEPGTGDEGRAVGDWCELMDATIAATFGMPLAVREVDTVTLSPCSHEQQILTSDKISNMIQLRQALHSGSCKEHEVYLTDSIFAYSSWSNCSLTHNTLCWKNSTLIEETDLSYRAFTRVT